MIQVVNKVVYCLEVTNAPRVGKRWFLYRNNDDWGPTHSLTESLEEADSWDDANEAISYYRSARTGVGYNIRVVEVKVHSTYESNP